MRQNESIKTLSQCTAIRPMINDCQETNLSKSAKIHQSMQWPITCLQRSMLTLWCF